MLPSNMKIEVPENTSKYSSNKNREISANKTRPPSASARKTAIKHEPCSSTLSKYHDSFVYFYLNNKYPHHLMILILLHHPFFFGQSFFYKIIKIVLKSLLEAREFANFNQIKL
jgi:hypothetical protein